MRHSSKAQCKFPSKPGQYEYAQIGLLEMQSACIAECCVQTSLHCSSPVCDPCEPTLAIVQNRGQIVVIYSFTRSTYVRNGVTTFMKFFL